MFQRILRQYIASFSGFSKEIWFLTLITFINRAGTMVLPFLSKYLKEDLHFSYSEVGWVMVCFGSGSMIGSWLGGKLSDKIGFYKIMVFSLFTSGILFFCLQFVTSFYGLCAAMFGIMIIADMFRPAMFVSLGVYAKPENRTRALTLVRLAINLGFAAGPAMGGLIIMRLGYEGLFWIDGASCIIAIILFRILVKERKKAPVSRHEIVEDNRSVFQDKPYWLFLFISFAMAMVFFQLFTTLPLYHREKYGLTEAQTGLLMSFNGLLIFFLEMPLVSYIERKKIQKIRIILWSTLLISISYYMLLIDQWVGILVVSLFVLSFGEMTGFPYTNSFAMSRATKGKEGRYMALYTMSFSLAHILSAKTGMEIIARWGYTANWFFMGSFGLLAVFATLWLQRIVKNEKISS
ncbi:MDR family MFS transporter [Flavobacterium sp. '19STA2R22 D10 B1']|uniref:MDR family MFS transporter n=1 Tax=Flavobacterium aerium TaxID=3037261 RepID=UPI00278C1D11|nr:MFS transporter [Flavobacterium sp. '19STA2R22 D10 B1']